MDSESESKTESGPGGIPLKASKPGGSSIRMTSSRESEPETPKPREKMADEEKKPEETPKSEEAAKPKLPPKKQAVAPPEKPGPEADAAAAVASGGSPERKTDEVGVSAGDAGSPKAPKLPPKTGPKPKLTPKIPAKSADPSAENPASDSSPRAGGGPAGTPKPAAAPKSPLPSKGGKPPPRPHVVRPGAATAPFRPTQGGSAVPMASAPRAKAAGVSPVGVAIDAVTALGALAVGYLILKDLLPLL